MPTADCAPDVALRTRLSGIKRITRRNLLLLFTGALPTLFVVASAKAKSSKNRAISAATGAKWSGHAMIFNEDASQGQQHAGSVTWRINRIKTAGKPDEIVVHAEIKIPDLKMKTKMDFKRNTDKSLPAGHVVELTIVMSQDVAGGEVIAVPGMLMKFTERGRGVPLVGQTVKVTKGFFLVGLSNVEVDRERNLQLLKERRWIDVPIVYANQHRGILAIEKGFHGEDIFNEAMTEWERPR